MSEKKGWEKYIGKTLIVQLRTQPYIGISGEHLEPVATEQGYGTSPVIRGHVTEVWDAGEETMMELQTTDPNPELLNNKVYILLNTNRDIGYITTIEATRIQTAQSVPQQMHQA
jgi:hypothetical protein